jgi:hypothetical protein
VADRLGGHNRVVWATDGKLTTVRNRQTGVTRAVLRHTSGEPRGRWIPSEPGYAPSRGTAPKSITTVDGEVVPDGDVVRYVLLTKKGQKNFGWASHSPKDLVEREKAFLDTSAVEHWRRYREQPDVAGPVHKLEGPAIGYVVVAHGNERYVTLQQENGTVAEVDYEQFGKYLQRDPGLKWLGADQAVYLHICHAGSRALDGDALVVPRNGQKVANIAGVRVRAVPTEVAYEVPSETLSGAKPAVLWLANSTDLPEVFPRFFSPEPSEERLQELAEQHLLVNGLSPDQPRERMVRMVRAVNEIFGIDFTSEPRLLEAFGRLERMRLADEDYAGQGRGGPLTWALLEDIARRYAQQEGALEPDEVGGWRLLSVMREMLGKALDEKAGTPGMALTEFLTDSKSFTGLTDLPAALDPAIWDDGPSETWGEYSSAPPAQSSGAEEPEQPGPSGEPDNMSDEVPQYPEGEWNSPDSDEQTSSLDTVDKALPVAPSTQATTSSLEPLVSGGTRVPEFVSPLSDPIGKEAWWSRRVWAAPAWWVTEVYDPARDPLAGERTVGGGRLLGGRHTLVRAGIRRVQAVDGRWVRDMEIVLPVRPGDGFTAGELGAFEAGLNTLLDERLNVGFVLPASHDQLNIGVRLLHAPGHRQAVEISRTGEPGRSDQLHFRLHTATTDAERQAGYRLSDDNMVLHELLHYAGVADRYLDPESLFRDVPGRAFASGVMADLSAPADGRLPADYLKAIETATDSGPVVYDLPLSAPIPGDLTEGEKWSQERQLTVSARQSGAGAVPVPVRAPWVYLSPPGSMAPPVLLHAGSGPGGLPDTTDTFLAATDEDLLFGAGRAPESGYGNQAVSTVLEHRAHLLHTAFAVQWGDGRFSEYLAGLEVLEAVRAADAELRRQPLDASVLKKMAHRVLRLSAGQPVGIGDLWKLYGVVQDAWSAGRAGSVVAIAAFYLDRYLGVFSGPKHVKTYNGRVRGRNWWPEPVTPFDPTRVGTYAGDGGVRLEYTKWSDSKPYVLLAEGNRKGVMAVGRDGTYWVEAEELAELLRYDPAMPATGPVVLFVDRAAEGGLEFPRLVADRLGGENRVVWATSGELTFVSNPGTGQHFGVLKHRRPVAPVGTWIPSRPGEVSPPGRRAEFRARNGQVYADSDLMRYMLPTEDGMDVHGWGSYTPEEAAAREEIVFPRVPAAKHWVRFYRHRRLAGPPHRLEGPEVGYTVFAHGDRTVVALRLRESGAQVLVDHEEFGGILRRDPGLRRLRADQAVALQVCYAATRAPNVDALVVPRNGQKVANAAGVAVRAVTSMTGYAPPLSGSPEALVLWHDTDVPERVPRVFFPEPSGEELQRLAKKYLSLNGLLPNDPLDHMTRMVRIVRAIDEIFGDGPFEWIDGRTGERTYKRSYEQLLTAFGTLESLRLVDRNYAAESGPLTWGLLERITSWYAHYGGVPLPGAPGGRSPFWVMREMLGKALNPWARSPGMTLTWFLTHAANLADPTVPLPLVMDPARWDDGPPETWVDPGPPSAPPPQATLLPLDGDTVTRLAYMDEASAFPSSRAPESLVSGGTRVPEFVSASKSPVGREGWWPRRARAASARLNTEIYDPAQDPLAGEELVGNVRRLGGRRTLVRVDIRRVQAFDGRWVRDLEIVLPVRPGAGFSAGELGAFEAGLSKLLDERVNIGFVLPASGDQLNLGVRLVHAPGHRQAVEISRTEEPGSSDQLHLRLHTATAAADAAVVADADAGGWVWDRQDDNLVLHELLHYAGVTDRYHDAESLFRNVPGKADASGVMADLSAPADGRLPADYLKAIEAVTDSGPVVYDLPLPVPGDTSEGETWSRERPLTVSARRSGTGTASVQAPWIYLFPPGSTAPPALLDAGSGPGPERARWHLPAYLESMRASGTATFHDLEGTGWIAEQIRANTSGGSPQEILAALEEAPETFLGHGRPFHLKGGDAWYDVTVAMNRHPDEPRPLFTVLDTPSVRADATANSDMTAHKAAVERSSLAMTGRSTQNAQGWALSGNGYVLVPVSHTPLLLGASLHASLSLGQRVTTRTERHASAHAQVLASPEGTVDVPRRVQWSLRIQKAWVPNARSLTGDGRATATVPLAELVPQKEPSRLGPATPVDQDTARRIALAFSLQPLSVDPGAPYEGGRGVFDAVTAQLHPSLVGPGTQGRSDVHDALRADVLTRKLPRMLAGWTLSEDLASSWGKTSGGYRMRATVTQIAPVIRRAGADRQGTRAGVPSFPALVSMQSAARTHGVRDSDASGGTVELGPGAGFIGGPFTPRVRFFLQPGLELARSGWSGLSQEGTTLQGSEIDGDRVLYLAQLRLEVEGTGPTSPLTRRGPSVTNIRAWLYLRAQEAADMGLPLPTGTKPGPLFTHPGFDRTLTVGASATSTVWSGLDTAPLLERISDLFAGDGRLKGFLPAFGGRDDVPAWRSSETEGKRMRANWRALENKLSSAYLSNHRKALLAGGVQAHLVRRGALSVDHAVVRVRARQEAPSRYTGDVDDWGLLYGPGLTSELSAGHEKRRGVSLRFRLNSTVIPNHLYANAMFGGAHSNVRNGQGSTLIGTGGGTRTAGQPPTSGFDTELILDIDVTLMSRPSDWRRVATPGLPGRQTPPTQLIATTGPVTDRSTASLSVDPVKVRLAAPASLTYRGRPPGEASSPTGQLPQALPIAVPPLRGLSDMYEARWAPPQPGERRLTQWLLLEDPGTAQFLHDRALELLTRASGGDGALGAPELESARKIEEVFGPDAVSEGFEIAAHHVWLADNLYFDRRVSDLRGAVGARLHAVRPRVRHVADGPAIDHQAVGGHQASGSRTKGSSASAELFLGGAGSFTQLVWQLGGTGYTRTWSRARQLSSGVSATVKYSTATEPGGRMVLVQADLDVLMAAEVSVRGKTPTVETYGGKLPGVVSVWLSETQVRELGMEQDLADHLAGLAPKASPGPLAPPLPPGTPTTSAGQGEAGRSRTAPPAKSAGRPAGTPVDKAAHLRLVNNGAVTFGALEKAPDFTRLLPALRTELARLRGRKFADRLLPHHLVPDRHRNVQRLMTVLSRVGFRGLQAGAVDGGVPVTLYQPDGTVAYVARFTVERGPGVFHDRPADRKSLIATAEAGLEHSQGTVRSVTDTGSVSTFGVPSIAGGERGIGFHNAALSIGSTTSAGHTTSANSGLKNKLTAPADTPVLRMRHPLTAHLELFAPGQDEGGGPAAAVPLPAPAEGEDDRWLLHRMLEADVRALAGVRPPRPLPAPERLPVVDLPPLARWQETGTPVPPESQVLSFADTAQARTGLRRLLTGLKASKDFRTTGTVPALTVDEVLATEWITTALPTLAAVGGFLPDDLVSGLPKGEGLRLRAGARFTNGEILGVGDPMEFEYTPGVTLGRPRRTAEGAVTANVAAVSSGSPSVGGGWLNSQAGIMQMHTVTGNRETARTTVSESAQSSGELPRMTVTEESVLVQFDVDLRLRTERDDSARPVDGEPEDTSAGGIEIPLRSPMVLRMTRSSAERLLAAGHIADPALHLPDEARASLAATDEDLPFAVSQAPPGYGGRAAPTVRSGVQPGSVTDPRQPLLHEVFGVQLDDVAHPDARSVAGAAGELDWSARVLFHDIRDAKGRIVGRATFTPDDWKHRKPALSGVGDATDYVEWRRSSDGRLDSGVRPLPLPNRPRFYVAGHGTREGVEVIGRDGMPLPLGQDGLVRIVESWSRSAKLSSDTLLVLLACGPMNTDVGRRLATVTGLTVVQPRWSAAATPPRDGRPARLHMLEAPDGSPGGLVLHHPGGRSETYAPDGTQGRTATDARDATSYPRREHHLSGRQRPNAASTTPPAYAKRTEIVHKGRPRGRNWTGADIDELDMSVTHVYQQVGQRELKLISDHPAPWGSGAWTVVADGDAGHVMFPGPDGRPARVPVEQAAAWVLNDPGLTRYPPDADVVLIVPGVGGQQMTLVRDIANGTGRRVWATYGEARAFRPPRRRGISALGDRRRHVAALVSRVPAGKLVGEEPPLGAWLVVDPAPGALPPVPAAGFRTMVGEQIPDSEVHVRPAVTANRLFGGVSMEDDSRGNESATMLTTREIAKVTHQHMSGADMDSEYLPRELIAAVRYRMSNHGLPGAAQLHLKSGRTVGLSGREYAQWLGRQRGIRELDGKAQIWLNVCWSASATDRALPPSFGEAAPSEHLYVADPLEPVIPALGQEVANVVQRIVWGGTRPTGFDFNAVDGSVLTPLTHIAAADGTRGRLVKFKPEPPTDQLGALAVAAGLWPAGTAVPAGVGATALRLTRALREVFGLEVEDDAHLPDGTYARRLRGVGALERMRANDPELGRLTPFTLDLLDHVARAHSGLHPTAKPDIEHYRSVLKYAVRQVQRSERSALLATWSIPWLDESLRVFADAEKRADRVREILGVAPAASLEGRDFTRAFWSSVRATAYMQTLGAADHRSLAAAALHLTVPPTEAHVKQWRLLLAASGAAGRDITDPVAVGVYDLVRRGALSKATMLPVAGRETPSARNWTRARLRQLTDAQVQQLARNAKGALYVEGMLRAPWAADAEYTAPYVVLAEPNPTGVDLTLPGDVTLVVSLQELAELIRLDHVHLSLPPTSPVVLGISGAGYWGDLMRDVTYGTGRDVVAPYVSLAFAGAPTALSQVPSDGPAGWIWHRWTSASGPAAPQGSVTRQTFSGRPDARERAGAHPAYAPDTLTDRTQSPTSTSSTATFSSSPLLVQDGADREHLVVRGDGRSLALALSGALRSHPSQRPEDDGDVPWPVADGTTDADAVAAGFDSWLDTQLTDDSDGDGAQAVSGLLPADDGTVVTETDLRDAGVVLDAGRQMRLVLSGNAMSLAELGLSPVQRLRLLLHGPQSPEATYARAVLAARKLGIRLVFTGADGTEHGVGEVTAPVIRLLSDDWHRPFLPEQGE